MITFIKTLAMDLLFSLSCHFDPWEVQPTYLAVKYIKVYAGLLG